MFPLRFSDEPRLSIEDVTSAIETVPPSESLVLENRKRSNSVQFSDEVQCQEFFKVDPAVRVSMTPRPQDTSEVTVRSVLQSSSIPSQDTGDTDVMEGESLAIDPSISHDNQALISAVARASNAENARQSILDDISTPTQNPIGNPRAFGAPSPNISSDQSGRALSRNLDRLQTEIRTGEQMLGESHAPSPSSSSAIDVEANELAEQPAFLPNDPSQIFKRKIPRPPLQPPSLTHQLDTIVAISQRKVPTPKPSPFAHAANADAANQNSQLIAKFDFDLQSLFDAFPNSTISPGSEFRQIEDIEKLLGTHPFWPKIQEILTKGASYTFKNLPSDTDRKQENDAILDYGNHASARKKPEALRKVMAKDAKYGYAFPVTFDCARQLKHGRAGPLGVAQHAGIDEKGEIILKDRLAHDQTFSMGHAPSLNRLVDESVLIDLVYGWCIDRLIHQLVAIRQKHPSERILICKFDWGAAYRRINGDGILTAMVSASTC